MEETDDCWIVVGMLHVFHYSGLANGCFLMCIVYSIQMTACRAHFSAFALASAANAGRTMQIRPPF